MTRPGSSRRSSDSGRNHPSTPPTRRNGAGRRARGVLRRELRARPAAGPVQRQPHGAGEVSRDALRPRPSANPSAQGAESGARIRREVALRDPAGPRRALARGRPGRFPQGRGGVRPRRLSRRRFVHRGGPDGGLDPRADRRTARVPLHQASPGHRGAIPGISRLAEGPARVQVGRGHVRPPPWDERRGGGCTTWATRRKASRRRPERVHSSRPPCLPPSGDIAVAGGP